MFKRLGAGHAIRLVIVQHFCDYFLHLRADVWNEFSDSSTLLLWKIELHVTGDFLKLLQQRFVWSTKNVVNFVDLIKFIVTWE